MEDVIIAVNLNDVDLLVIKNCIRKEIKYVETCDFKKEFNPLDYNKKDVVKILNDTYKKIDEALRMYGRL